MIEVIDKTLIWLHNVVAAAKVHEQVILIVIAVCVVALVIGSISDGRQR